ncbi:MAG: hypothetical protein B7Y78_11485 [Caulobacter sp. 35-67-4]|nr:MAG: hypothetical protein B7Y78_11485 [Caulobacter sp. 35-67-4]
MPNGAVWLYGTHAVAAALGNPARRLRRLVITEDAQASLAAERPQPWAIQPEITDRAKIDTLLGARPGSGIVHQGVALLTDQLTSPALLDALHRPGPILVLDQISDPRNIGALMRTAQAFGASMVIAQERNAPEETGALAKAADLGEQLFRPGHVGKLSSPRRQVGFEAHAVQDVLVVEEREGLQIQGEIVAGGRPIAPLFQQIDQALGDRSLIDIVAPERLGPLAEAIVQLQEGDDVVVARRHQLVEPPGRRGDRAIVREELGDDRHRRLDQHHAGGFQRLKEASRQAHGDAILDPRLLAITGVERQRARGDLDAVADIAAQSRLGLIVGHVIAGIDAAHPPRAVQADVPDPAGLVGGRDREALDRRLGPVLDDLAGQGPVSEQG